MTFVRFSTLNASITRSSFPCGLMLKYLRIRRSSVADAGNRHEFRPTVQGSRGERKGAAPVVITAGGHVDRVTRPDGQNRGDLNVAERANPRVRHLTELPVLFFADGKIEQCADGQAVALVVPRIRPLVRERIRVLGLFIEIGSRVSRVRPGVGRRPLNLMSKAPVQRQRDAVVRR